MARIERASPEIKAPVKQAVLIDPNAFKFTGAGEGLKAIGGVLAELGERRKKAQDSLSITETNNSQSLAQAEIKQFMVDNPNPDDWEVGIQSILDKQDVSTSQLKSSPETRARIEQSQKAFREQTVLDSSILQTEATIDIDVQSSGAALIAAIGTGDELAIVEARDTHEAALLRKEAPEIAALSLIETLAQGEKQRISVLVENGEFEAARKLASKTKGLEPTERVAQINFINSAETRAEKRLDAGFRDKQSALYAREDAGEILKREEFEAAWLDPEKADQHFDEYQIGLVAEAKGEANFVKEGDPVFLAKTEAVIDLNPMTITESQLYANATAGIGTKNVTRLVDRLRNARKGKVDEFDRRLSTLFNSNYFGDTDDDVVGVKFKRAQLVMKDFLSTQKPSKIEAEVFFNGLITKDFTGFRRGGFEEKGFKHTYVDIAGNEVTQRFRFGDIRTRNVDGKILNEFYAGTDDDGDPLWLPRQ